MTEINSNLPNIYYDEPAMRRLVNHLMTNKEEPIEKAIEVLQELEVPEQWWICDLFDRLVHRIYLFLFTDYSDDFTATVEKIHVYVTSQLLDIDVVPAPSVSVSATIEPVKIEPMKIPDPKAVQGTLSNEPTPSPKSPSLIDLSLSFINIGGIFGKTSEKEIQAVYIPPEEILKTKEESVKDDKEPEATPAPIVAVKTTAQKIELLKKFISESSELAEAAKLYPKKDVLEPVAEPITV